MDKLDKISEMRKDNIVPDYIDMKIQETRNIIRKENKIIKKNRNAMLCVASLAAVLMFNYADNTVLADIKQFMFGGRYGKIEDEGYSSRDTSIYTESNGVKVEYINGMANSKLINIRLKISSKDVSKLDAIDNRNYFSSINTFKVTDDKGRVIGDNTSEDEPYIPIYDETGNEIFLTTSYDEVIHDSEIDKGIIYLDIMYISDDGNLKGIESINMKSRVIGDVSGNWNLDISFDKNK